MILSQKQLLSKVVAASLVLNQEMKDCSIYNKSDIKGATP
jgi:hypothetical protein